MSSACSTSYNIHEAQHLIPACPFNGCRYPVVASTACFSGYSGDSIRLFTAFWELHTHTNAHRGSHTLCAGRCHGYIKAETANFDQLLTVMEGDSGDTEKWWNKVLPSLPPFILIGICNTVSHPLWRNRRWSLVRVHVHQCMGLERGARRNYEEIRRRSRACFEIQHIGCPQGPHLIPSSHSFLYYSIWSVIRECIMTGPYLLPFFPAQRAFDFFQRVARAECDWLERGRRRVSADAIRARGISAQRTPTEVAVMCHVCGELQPYGRIFMTV